MNLKKLNNKQQNNAKQFTNINIDFDYLDYYVEKHISFKLNDT
jgi:hypothetical protein